ncbi:helix-turn-helix transcriptional regulator [Pseudomonas nitroreducens]|uniref:helix-turn-helix transcriptional regulator n=1 Tax=Pseudomonas nitroreducens TaxID=46680 RepID=UPI0028ADB78D|nr:helix-turn-helix transcriptional regulator [Pseudomonas nitroreducens]
MNKIESTDEALSLLTEWGFSSLLDALGTNAMCQQLLQFVQRFIPTLSIEIYYFKRSPSLQNIVDLAYLGSATDDAAQLDSFHKSGLAYIAEHSHLGTRCVDYKYILSLQSSGVHLTSVEKPESDEQREFYQQVYLNEGEMAELLSYAGILQDGVFTLTLSRHVDMARFNSQEQQQLLSLGNFLLPLLGKHYELLPAISSVKGEPYGLHQRFEHQLQREAIQLSTRERDICVCILMGMSASEIGLSLGIATSSVVTYKQRAFSKLGVTNQQALFSWCFLSRGW